MSKRSLNKLNKNPNKTCHEPSDTNDSEPKTPTNAVNEDHLKIQAILDQYALNNTDNDYCTSLTCQPTFDHFGETNYFGNDFFGVQNFNVVKPELFETVQNSNSFHQPQTELIFSPTLDDTNLCAKFHSTPYPNPYPTFNSTSDNKHLSLLLSSTSSTSSSSTSTTSTSFPSSSTSPSSSSLSSTSTTTTNEIWINNQRCLLPNVQPIYPSNFSSLRFNGSRLLKPLNWVDPEIIQIIEDMIDRGVSVNVALHRIYDITGDRPSKRILQQRVRRYREFRIKESKLGKYGTYVDPETKMAANERLRSFYNSFDPFPTSSPEQGQNVTTERKKRTYKTSKKIKPKQVKNEEYTNNFSSNSGYSSASNETSFFNQTSNDQYPGYGSCQSDYVCSMVKVEPFNEQNCDEAVQNFQFSNYDSFGSSNFQQFNYPVPKHSPHPWQEHSSCPWPENFGYLSLENSTGNFTENWTEMPLTEFPQSSSGENSGINGGPYFSPLHPPQLELKTASQPKKNRSVNKQPRQVESYLKKICISKTETPSGSDFTSSSNSMTSDEDLSNPYIPNLYSPSEDFFEKIDFHITPQGVNAFIDAIDHDWINKLLDENSNDLIDVLENHDSPKILNPVTMKNLCINIENILNFMRQSITVFVLSNHETTSDPKKWKTFGEVLTDLLKLKEMYESFDVENIETIINRTIFVKDVNKWILGGIFEANEQPKIPKTHLNIKQFQRFIKFLKDFNSYLFDYSTSYEYLYAAQNDTCSKIPKLSSILANCVLIISEIVASVTVVHDIVPEKPFVFAKL